MSKYSKAFGSIFGGLIVLGGAFGLEEPDPALVGAASVIFPAIFTYLFPANAL
jgi:hypothetical protein